MILDTLQVWTHVYACDDDREVTGRLSSEDISILDEPAGSMQNWAKGPLPGRGGPHHKYLQSLVKRVAEDRDFAVSLEKTVLDGHGYVDVALEREELSVACEISVTTRVAHELGNLTH